LLVGAKIDLGEASLVIFLGELLVFKTVFFIAKPHAKEAILTSNAVSEKSAGVAVDAILRGFEAIRAVDVDAVVAKLGMKVVKSIHAGDGPFEAVAVHAVFAVVGVHDEITVLRGTGEVHVVTVDVGAVDDEGEEGSAAAKFIELFEKRTRKIERAAIIAGIPLVAVPTFFAITGSFLGRGVLG